MTKNKKALIVALTATALIAAAPARAESQPTPDQQKMTPQQISADKDFGKLSADGAGGFQDLSLARLTLMRAGDVVREDGSPVDYKSAEAS